MAELGVGEKAPDIVNVVIEIQRNAVNKYELDKETGLTMLDRVMPVSMVYPADYGYVPHTLCEDGDALDALIVINESVPQGIVVPARPIGVLRMVDEGEADEKIFCVAADDISHAHIKEVDDLGPQFKRVVEHFFGHYKDWKNDWKGVDVHFDGWGNAAEARQVVEDTIKRYQEQA